MNDIIDFFTNILYKFDQSNDYYKEKLETIAAENGQFVYIDDRRNYFKPLIENIKKVFKADDRISILEQILKTDCTFVIPSTGGSALSEVSIHL